VSRESCIRNRFVKCSPKQMFIGLIKSVSFRMVEQVARKVGKNVCRILVGEAKGKRLFGKHRYE